MESDKQYIQTKMLLDAENEWKEINEKKKESIKFKPVKTSHICICGSMAEFAAIAVMANNFFSFDAIVIGGFGSYGLGCLVPYMIKKIKIAELNFQILNNDIMINDLKKQIKSLK